MADTVNLPLVGPTSKGAAFGGIMAAGAVGGYLLYKHFKKKTPPVNPAAGAGSYGYGQYAYGYGSQEAYGYGAYTYDGGYGYGSFGGGGGGGGGVPGSYPPYGYGSYGYGQGTPAPTTNAQWMQNAISALSMQGYSGITATTALSIYLTGGSLSSDQVNVVRAAISAEGNPPQSGPNGYPPAINQGGGGGGGGQGGGTATVPNVIGYTAGAAHNAIVAASLHPVADKGQKATWIVTYTQPQAGTKLNPGDNVLIQASPGGK